MNNLPREKQIEVIAANPREALDYVQKPKRPVLNLRVAYFGQYRQSDTKPFHPQPTSVRMQVRRLRLAALDGSLGKFQCSKTGTNGHF